MAEKSIPQTIYSWGEEQPPKESIDQVSPAYIQTDSGIPGLPCARPGDNFSENDLPEGWKGVTDCFTNRLPILIFFKKKKKCKPNGSCQEGAGNAR